MSVAELNLSMPAANSELHGGRRTSPTAAIGLSFDDHLMPLGRLADEATRLIGRKVATSVMHKWASVGHRGVRLACLQTPRGRISSVAALEDFFRKLTAASEAESGGEVYVQSPQGDQRSFGRARPGIVAGT